jgi:hypothetical protein
MYPMGIKGRKKKRKEKKNVYKVLDQELYHIWPSSRHSVA